MYNMIAAALEQEAKFMQDSLEGDRQYRRGYVHALEAAAAFLLSQSGDWSSNAENRTVQRLASFAGRSSEAIPLWGERLESSQDRSAAEQQEIEIARAVLRSADSGRCEWGVPEKCE